MDEGVSGSEPPGTKSNARALQITNAEAPKLQRPAYLGPADQAAADSHFLAALPEEVTDDPGDFLQDGRGDCHRQQDVGGHGGEHVTH